MKTINSILDINVSRILRLIWQKRVISRIEIATELGLDKSTITKIVTTLLEIGIICEFSVGNSGPQGGRKPIHLVINTSFAVVGGVEVNPDRLTCCLLDLNGTILFRYEKVRPYANSTDDFLEAFTLLKKNADERNIPMLSIGMGLPGIIDSDSGVIAESIPLNIYEPLPFALTVSKFVGIPPVYIENDARCCCYGERILVFDQALQNAVFVLTEIRKVHHQNSILDKLVVGMGFVFNGKIFRGSSFSAGEFRSIYTDKNKPLQLHCDEYNFNFAENEEKSREVFAELALHIAFLVNTLNLDMIYLGGISDKLMSILSVLISEHIQSSRPYKNSKEYKIKVATLGELSVAFGAAALCLDHFFSLPSLSSSASEGLTILESLERVAVK